MSFVDGGKFRNKLFTDYKYGIRKVSDELCRENNLQVIQPQGKGKSYPEVIDERQGKPTLHSIVKEDIDAVIAQSFTFQHFLDGMKQRGYTLRHGPRIKHMSVRAPGSGAVRLDSFGDPQYTEQGIKDRISRQRDGHPAPAGPIPASVPQVKRYRPAGTIPRPRRKLKGFAALYFHYLYLFGKVRRSKAPARIPFEVRKAMTQAEKYRKQFLFLYRNGIETTTQLDEYQTRAADQVTAITEARRPLYTQRRYAKNEDEAAEITARIDSYNTRLRELRKDISMCRRIGEAAPAIQAQVLRAREIERRLTEKKRPGREQMRPVL